MIRAKAIAGIRSLLLTGIMLVTGASVAAPAQASSPAWQPIAASGPTNLPPAQSEIQRVAVDAEGGDYTLTFDGQTTAPIMFNAGASQVAASLEALSTIDGVTVKGGPGGKSAKTPYFVTFGGSLTDTDVDQMTADSGGMSGGDVHTALVSTAVNGGQGTANIAVYVQNVGGDASSGMTTLTFTLPAGVTTTETPKAEFSGDPEAWDCLPEGAGQSTVTCTTTWAAEPGMTLPALSAPVTSSPGATSDVVHIEVSGGGTLGTAIYEMPLVVSAIPAPPGLQAFTAGTYDDEGEIDTRAGAHPYSASTGFLSNTVRSTDTGQVVAAGDLRDIVVDTPPGFIGNPIAAAQCPEELDQPECEHASIVANVQISLGVFGDTGGISPVNNIQAPFGFPAKFRFRDVSKQVVINVAASLRSDEDYGLEIGSYDTAQIKPVFGAFFTIWGTPAAPSHDAQRCREFDSVGNALDCGPGGESIAFLSNPVDCAEEALRPPVATVNFNTWQSRSFLFAGDVALQPVQHCDELELEAGFEFEPSDTEASDSPASFRTEVTVPSEGLTDPDLLMTPTIKETVVDLPTGVVLNASAADGLGACSKEQIGLKGTTFEKPNQIRFTKNPNTCPDSSKIGSGELKSELIEEPLQADIFLAEQGEGNPFGSLFAIYLVIEDPRHGIFIKLPGEVQVNEQDGQQRIVFRELPPLPFTYLKLNLKGGARSPLATPTTCGDYRTTTTNTPWSAPESGPPHVSGGGFQIGQGPNGMPCASTEADRPFTVGLAAGSTNPVAGAHSIFRLQVTRGDGNQEIDRLDLSPPPGLVASLKGIPYCSDSQIAAAGGTSGRSEQATPSCPQASEVGTTNSAAGSGPSPFYAPGKLYLAGPYKGAPLSVVAITPAVAGPFDLGNVVVRSALRVNPVTARITAETDPLPRILKGVPLRIRDVRVNLDRSGWAQNPTSCDPMSVDLTAHGSHGRISAPSNLYQVGNCAALGFAPQMSLTLRGGVKRGANPALTAVVRPRPGDANIARAAVTLPRSAFLDQAHIRTVCTRVQFAADQCPKAAIYGRAVAETPLLDQPLVGPVYLRSSSNKLPDLVADLRGPAHQPIKIEAAFRTDSIRGGIRSTIDVAPDAPVTKFTLLMQGGKKGLVVNSQNLCANVNRANARMVGQNGRTYNSKPKVVATNCAKQQRRRARNG